MAIVSAADDQTSAQITAAINDLAAPKIKTRIEASNRLRAIGRPAIDAVSQAADNHPDAEVRRLASKLRTDFRLGMFADTPRSIIAAVRDTLSGNTDRENAGLKVLIEAELFDTILAAIETARNPVARRRLAVSVLETHAARKHFLEATRWKSLIDAVANDGLPQNPQLLLSRSTIDAIVMANGVDDLLDFASSWPADAKAGVWQQIASSRFVHAKLLTANDGGRVLDYIARGTNDVQRNSIALGLSLSPQVMSLVIRQGRLNEYLDHLKQPSSIVYGMLMSDESFRSIFDSMTAQQIIALYEMVILQHQRDHVFDTLERTWDEVRLIDGKRVSARVSSPEAIGKIDEVLQHFFGEGNEENQKRRLMRRLTQLGGGGIPTKDVVRSTMASLIELEVEWTSQELIRVGNLSHRYDVFSLPKTLEWFLAQSLKLQGRERELVLMTLMHHRDFVNTLLESDQDRFMKLLDALLESNSPEISTPLQWLGRQVDQMPADSVAGLFDKLIQRVDEVPASPANAKLLQFICNRPPMRERGLIAAEPSPILTRVDKLTDVNRQVPCYLALAQDERVTKYFVDHERWDVLTGYRDATWSANDRREMFSIVTREPSTLNALIEHGEFDALENAAQTFVETKYTTNYQLMFLTSAPVLNVLQERGRLNELNDALKIVPEQDFIESLAWIGGNQPAAAVFDVIGESLWARMQNVAMAKGDDRDRSLRSIFYSAEFLNWLRERHDLETVIDALQDVLTDREFVPTIKRLARDKPGQAWLHESPTETLMSLLDVVARLQGTNDRHLAAELFATVSQQISIEESQPFVDRCLAWLERSLSDDEGADYFLRHKDLFKNLIRLGATDRMLDLVAGNPNQLFSDPLTQLIYVKEFATEYLQNHRAIDLLTMVFRSVDPNQPNSHSSVFEAMLRSKPWLDDLILNGDLDLLIDDAIAGRGMAFASDNTRRRTLRDLLGSPLPVTRLPDQKAGAMVRVLVNHSAEPEKLFAEFSQSEWATRRLIRLGYFDDLHAAALEVRHSSFFQMNEVFESMNANQQADAIDRFVKAMDESEHGFHWRRGSLILARYVRENGVAAVLKWIRQPHAEYQIQSLWLDETFRTELVRRGELLTLWNVTPERQRGVVLANFFIHESSFREALDSPAAAEGMVAWLESMPDQSLNRISLGPHSSIAWTLHRNGLGNRCDRLAYRANVSRSIHGPLSLNLRDRITLAVLNGDIDRATGLLRQSVTDADSAGTLASFLIATGQAGDETAWIERLPIDRRDRWDRLCHVLLRRGVGDVAESMELAKKYDMPGIASMIAVDQHDWKSAIATDVARPFFLEHRLKSNVASMQTIERILVGARLALFNDDLKTYQEALAELKAIDAAKPNDIQTQAYVGEALILLARTHLAVNTLRSQAWWRYRLYAATGFYDFANAAVGMGNRSAKEFFDAQSYNKPADDRRRIHAMDIMMDVAETNEMLGLADRAAEFRDALINFSDDSNYQSKLAGKWIARGNVAAADAWMNLNKEHEAIQVGNEAFGKPLPHHWVSLEWALRGRASISIYSQSIAILLRNVPTTMNTVQQVRLASELVDDPTGHPFAKDFLELLENYLDDQQSSGRMNTISVFETTIKLWAMAGQPCPIDEQRATYWIDQTDDVETLRWYAVSKIGDGDHAEAARVLGRAVQLSPSRADLRYLQADVRCVAPASPTEHLLALDERKAASMLLYAPFDRIRLAESLLSIGQTDAAMEQLQILRRTTIPEDRYHSEAIAMLIDVVPTMGQRYQLCRQQLIAMSRVGVDRSDKVALMRVVTRLHETGMRLTLQQKDWAGVRTQYQWSRWSNVNHHAWMIEFIPQVRSAGNEELAERMRQDTLTFVRARAAKFPNSTVFANAEAALKRLSSPK